MAEMPLGLRIAIIDRMFKHKMDERAKEMGLTSVQLRVLGEVSLMESMGVEEINQKDLEKIEKVTHPTMTGIIQRLESNDFIICRPSPTDRRYKKINCTEKSVGIHKQIEALDKEIWKEMCKSLTDEQADKFLFIIDLILSNLSDN